MRRRTLNQFICVGLKISVPLFGITYLLRVTEPAFDLLALATALLSIWLGCAWCCTWLDYFLNDNRL
jgi:hypothetical protein